MDIITEHVDGVLSITMNRPARKNALTAAMYQTMADAFFDAENDPAVRVVLIRAVGDTFSSGNDIEDFMKAPPATQDAPVFQFLRRISTAQKPVVAAVAGGAVGIGTTMLLHCDLVYAASTAKFALPFVQLGLCPEAASSLPSQCRMPATLDSAPLMDSKPATTVESTTFGSRYAYRERVCEATIATAWSRSRPRA